MTLKLCRDEGGDRMHCDRGSLAQQQTQLREPAWVEGRLPSKTLSLSLSPSLSLKWSLGSNRTWILEQKGISSDAKRADQGLKTSRGFLAHPLSTHCPH